MQLHLVKDKVSCSDKLFHYSIIFLYMYGRIETKITTEHSFLAAFAPKHIIKTFDLVWLND